MRSTAEFIQSRHVFTLEEARVALNSRGSAASMRERLKHYVRTRRLKTVATGVYAVVPFEVPSETYQPDAYLVAAAIRQDAVFAYYSAIVLLGAARVEWDIVTILTARRRPSLYVGNVRVDFASRPRALLRSRQEALGVRTVDRLGRTLRVTGPERTLVEGLREPGRVGGLSELVAAAGSFPVLDLDLVARLVKLFDERRLCAAVGWFLERHKDSFSVPETLLRRLERCRPGGRVYAERQRGGRLARRWNLILPEELLNAEAPR